LEGRFVDTPKRRMDDAAGAFAASGFGTRGLPDAPVANNDDVNAANTALLDVGDEIWALWEAGSPYRIDPADLSARGPVTFRNDLRHMPFSAHPKVEPGGRVWNFGLAYGRPSSIIWALAPDGSLERAELIDLPRTSYLHDWAVSETKLIFPLQPWVSARQRPPFVTSLKWRPEDGMQILVVDKDDFSKRRIFDAPAAFFFHTGDAYEERDGTIRFDACFGDGPVLGPEDGARIVRGLPLTGPTAQMAAMTLRPDGTVRYERTGEPAEFPVTDRRRQGRAHGAVWSVTEDGAVGDAPYTFNGVMRTDWNSGGVDRFFFGADRLAEEHVFVPRPGATGERDGWLVGAWLNVAERATELAVFDAARLADGPLAVWRSDVALPIGFHGLWRGA
ncbi:MAG: carotenoid oxygenase family protein, partial [Pseudomonadota bacterium]